jgi:hypothetical protein
MPGLHAVQVTVNEEVDPALVVERLKVENAMLKSELRFVSMFSCKCPLTHGL